MNNPLFLISNTITILFDKGCKEKYFNVWKKTDETIDRIFKAFQKLAEYSNKDREEEFKKIK